MDDPAVAGPAFADRDDVVQPSITRVAGLEDRIGSEIITGFRTLRIVGLGEIKEYLNIPATDRTRDAKILRLADGLSPVIEFYVGPVLQRQIIDSYDGGTPYIILRRSPVVSVQSVVEYRGPIPYNLT